jgi:predicted permease
LQEATAEVRAIEQRLAAQYSFMAGWDASAVPLKNELAGNLRTILLLLGGVVSFVLLMACSNIASLLLARGANRDREVALRSALGAGTQRIFSQLVTESLVLAIVGGVCGCVLASALLQLLPSIRLTDWSIFGTIGLDRRVLGFALTISVLAGLAFGVVPAIQLSKSDLSSSLQRGMSRMNKRSLRFQSVLIVGQFALALVLLAGANLMVESLWRIAQVNSGFRSDHLLTLRVSLPRARYPNIGDLRLFYNSLLDRVTSLTGVQDAGVASNMPLQGQTNVVFALEGASRPSSANYLLVSDGYFKAMKITVIRGTNFTGRESEESPPVAIVNDTLARSLFPEGGVLGHRLKLGRPEETGVPWREIVGVIADVRNAGVDKPPAPEIYVPYTQDLTHAGTMSLVVRTLDDPLRLAENIKGAIWSLDGDQPVFAVQTLDQILSVSNAQRRVTMFILVGFSLLALTLAATGLYGSMTYAVAQRTQEIGLRMALGAGPRTILASVLGRSLALASLGAVLGGIGGGFLTRFLTTYLFEVRSLDLIAFASAIVVLFSVAAFGSIVPAHRASRIDPIEALRGE